MPDVSDANQRGCFCFVGVYTCDVKSVYIVEKIDKIPVFTFFGVQQLCPWRRPALCVVIERAVSTKMLNDFRYKIRYKHVVACGTEQLIDDSRVQSVHRFFAFWRWVCRFSLYTARLPSARSKEAQPFQRSAVQHVRMLFVLTCQLFWREFHFCHFHCLVG